MEPFGLFQFLQSFLNQTPENAPATPPASTGESTDNVAPTMVNAQTEQTANDDAPPNASNQAFLSFMQAHETRAKRIKKP